MALRDHRWAFRPVSPLGLFNLLSAALGLQGEGGACNASEVVSVPMPTESDVQFRDKYLLREVLRKYPAFDLGIDTRTVAKEAFYADEAINRLTNDRLLSELPSGAVAQVLNLARKKIAKILGRFDEREFWDGWRFGPHSTLSLRRDKATIENKLRLNRPYVSLSCYPLYAELRSRNPFWAYTSEATTTRVACIEGWQATLCQYDKWTSVRKNARTDRGIGIPPDGNVACQLSVGRMLRSRLYEAGVNLNDQSINQTAALRASITGETATIDVQGASQAVTTGLVWNLLGAMPSQELDMRWYAVLDALRTTHTLVDGDLHENELFSAMGNGYTFELESLIFYGLAWACTSLLASDVSLVSVYGDDIILPVDAYDLLLETFQYCGFRINKEKSFASQGKHRFRESCGKHFLNGTDVTPFYVDSPLDNPSSIILLANNLHRWACKSDPSGLTRDGRIYPVWLWVLSHLGEGYLSCGIPDGEANDGIILSWDEVAPRAVYLKGHRTHYPTFIGWKAKTAEYKPRPVSLDDESRYLRWQYTRSGHSGFKPPRVERQRWLPAIWSAFSGLCGSGDRVYAGHLPCGRVSVESAINTVPEVPRSIGLKAELRLGSRVVSSWSSLGPWVGVDVIDAASFRLHLAIARESLSLTPGIAAERDARKGQKARR